MCIWSGLASFSCFRKSLILWRWSPCGCITSPHSGFSKTVPLQLNSCEGEKRKNIEHVVLIVSHEGLNKQAIYALILLTSIKIMELKFLKHGCLTIKKHDSQLVKRQSYKGMISKTQNNNEDQNAPMTAHHNPPITSNYGVTNSDTLFLFSQHPKWVILPVNW